MSGNFIKRIEKDTDFDGDRKTADPGSLEERSARRHRHRLDRPGMQAVRRRSTFTSAPFAMQMIEGVQKVRFTQKA